jgi:L-amino acid N-acyltransferase YncA
MRKRMVKGVKIRSACRGDLAAINDIYNYYVATSTCTYQEEPEIVRARAKWFAEHDAAHPVIVAELDGEVIAWASLSWFRSRCAYRYTVEDSVYVRHDLHGRGIGEALLRRLIGLARKLGHRTIIASISGEQSASIALHRKLGFLRAGRLRRVGFKFGRWLDVVYMQLTLRGDATRAGK